MKQCPYVKLFIGGAGGGLGFVARAGGGVGCLRSPTGHQPLPKPQKLREPHRRRCLVQFPPWRLARAGDAFHEHAMLFELEQMIVAAPSAPCLPDENHETSHPILVFVIFPSSSRHTNVCGNARLSGPV